LVSNSAVICVEPSDLPRSSTPKACVMETVSRAAVATEAAPSSFRGSAARQTAAGDQRVPGSSDVGRSLTGSDGTATMPNSRRKNPAAISKAGGDRTLENETFQRYSIQRIPI